MPARRCSICNINHPVSVKSCPNCDEPTWLSRSLKADYRETSDQKALPPLSYRKLAPHEEAQVEAFGGWLNTISPNSFRF